MQMITIAVFGGSGRTGRHVLEQALDAGYSVRALVRRATSITVSSPRLVVIEGDVLDPVSVEATVAGADVVISVFGQIKGSPPSLQADGTRNIVRAMQKADVRRIVSLSGGGLPFPEKDRPKLLDRVIRLLLKILSPAVLADAKAHLAVLEGSGLDWTVVRGPVLTDQPRTGKYRVGWVGVNASAKIGRADLAEFILTQATDSTFSRQLPFVSY